MPFFLSTSSVLMACFCVRHLHNSQDCQKDLYLTPVFLSVHAHVHTRAHTQSQHQRSCRGREPVAIFFFQGMVSSGKMELPLGGGPWFHLSPASRLLQALARKHGVHISQMHHWATWVTKAFHAATTLLLPSPQCERLTGHWNLDAKSWHSEYLSVTEWLISTEFWRSSPCGYHTFKAKRWAKEQVSWLIQTITYCSTCSSRHLSNGDHKS